MGFIKLAEPGSSHTLTIRTVKDDRSGNYPDWQFSDGTDTVVVPQKAMERQLTRLEVATAFDLVGSTVKFSRSTELGKNGKPFYNADLASPRDLVPSKRLPPPPAKPLPFDEGYGDEGGEVGMSGPPDAPLHGEEYAALRAEEPAQTPREAAALGKEAEYLALFTRVATHMATECARLRIPLDASACQAATYSVWGVTGRGR